jgi:hypothetical protein
VRMPPACMALVSNSNSTMNLYCLSASCTNASSLATRAGMYSSCGAARLQHGLHVAAGYATLPFILLGQALKCCSSVLGLTVCFWGLYGDGNLVACAELASFQAMGPLHAWQTAYISLCCTQAPVLLPVQQLCTLPLTSVFSVVTAWAADSYTLCRHSIHMQKHLLQFACAMACNLLPAVLEAVS